VGAKVVAASWDVAATAFPTPKARKVKLLPAEKRLHENYALVVLIPPEVDAAAGDKVMSAIALEPERVLRALLERPAGAPPERIVLLSPVVPLHTAGQEKDLRFLRAARAAQLSFIRSLAASADNGRATIVAIAPAWGTGPDGVPLRASGLEAEARILVTTIAGISFDRTGEILDLHGSRLPF
jgi:NAD(P)-dependent dehydrogenase (short-subunit alcohol dehydrogenase family)